MDGPASLEFATVGDPGNAQDATGFGSVGYTYQIGKYDVTAAQYVVFLNSVAKTDPYGLFNSDMATRYSTIAITRTGNSGNYSYSVTGSMAGRNNVPAFGISWADAIRFCNWLQNGQPTGNEGPGTTEMGAYNVNGAVSDSDLMAVTRTPGARYFLPTENEWYKAAYYKGGGSNAGYWRYPTKSNTAPSNVLSFTGTNNANYCPYNNGSPYPYTDPVNRLTVVGAFSSSPSPYGEYDMGGDVWQWNDTVSGDGLSYGLRGGCWGYDFSDYLASSWAGTGSPNQAWPQFGFRIVAESVPEPSTLALLGIGAFGLLGYSWRRKRG